MRLSDSDAAYLARRLSDDAVMQIEEIVGHLLDTTDEEVLADDLAEGFQRVLMAAEIYS